ncbi:MAG: hypothetical protein WCV90_06025 [Candidatus Woesearchaeota archaeon]|jgi:hypothetical protein
MKEENGNNLSGLTKIVLAVTVGYDLGWMVSVPLPSIAHYVNEHKGPFIIGALSLGALVSGAYALKRYYKRQDRIEREVAEDIIRHHYDRFEEERKLSNEMD